MMMMTMKTMTTMMMTAKTITMTIMMRMKIFGRAAWVSLRVACWVSYCSHSYLYPDSGDSNVANVDDDNTFILVVVILMMPMQMMMKDDNRVMVSNSYDCYDDDIKGQKVPQYLKKIFWDIFC